MPSSEWHWEQGVKFATEGIKTSLLLNGAAAIALMTFANTHSVFRAMKVSLTLFAFGAMASAVAFIAAYFAQLQYGNAEIPGTKDKNRAWRIGRWSNGTALALVVLSVALFFAASIVLLESWPTVMKRP